MAISPFIQEQARFWMIRSLPVAAPSHTEALLACNARRDFKRAAHAWAVEHNLDRPWCIERLAHVIRRAARLGHNHPTIWWTWASDPVFESVSALMREWDAPAIKDDSRDAVFYRARLSANPLTESKAKFLKRASEHYDSRVEGLHEHDIVVPHVRSELRQHAEWFIRFQVARESYGQLAKACGAIRRRDASEARKAQTQRAVTRFAEVIDMPLRTRKHEGNGVTSASK